MEPLQYKVIKTLSQYKSYCKILEELVTNSKSSKSTQDTIELLTLLIEKWDKEHNTFSDADPVELLKFLIKENKLKAIDLAGILGVSKSLVSDILHYRRGFSRDIIRKLAERFKVSQELFNRDYKLISTQNKRLKKSGTIKTSKKLSKAV